MKYTDDLSGGTVINRALAPRVHLAAMMTFVLIATVLAAPSPGAIAAPQMRAPDFTLKDLGGKTIKLSQFKGKVVLVNFWATWCPPCVFEMPSLEALHGKYKGKGLVVLGISLDDEPARDVPGFLAKFKKERGVKITYPLVVGDESVGDAFGGIRGIPTTFLIDRKGNIAKKYIGPPATEIKEIQAKFGEEIAKLL
jgi:peroxiredoxin